MQVVYTLPAVKDLKGLPRKVAERITKKIDWCASHEDPLRYAKRLNPPFDDLYRFRIGEYRAVFELNKKQLRLLVILRIKHRKDVYE